MITGIPLLIYRHMAKKSMKVGTTLTIEKTLLSPHIIATAFMVPLRVPAESLNSDSWVSRQ
jgi:hypothetical protein